MTAEASKRAASRTELVIGKVRLPVGLFTTTAKPGKLVEFTTGGPNGGVLFRADDTKEKALSNETPVPSMSLGAMDPLGADPGSEAPPLMDEGATAAGAKAVAAEAPSLQPSTLTPGEFTVTLVEEGTMARVSRDEVRRGVRKQDGTFIDCTEQLKAIEEETKLDQMEVVDFIDVGQIERARICDSYYVGADDPRAVNPLKMVWEAMRAERRVAVVKWSMRSRQSLGVLVAHGRSGCLVLLKLAWAEDWREAPAKALSVKNAVVSPEEIMLARNLVAAMGGKTADLNALRDDAIERREELYASAVRGEVAAVVPPAAVDADLALEEAFAASIAELLEEPVAGKA